MHILIENSETQEYLVDQDRWTKNPTEGRRFSGTTAALKVAKTQPLGRFNIVGHIPGTFQVVNLDHGRGRGAGAAPAASN
jgi:hypothetical protein